MLCSVALSHSRVKDVKVVRELAVNKLDTMFIEFDGTVTVIRLDLYCDKTTLKARKESEYYF